ncbi:MAG: Glutamine--tRNA ligase, partial [Planctomycetota bacterium]
QPLKVVLLNYPEDQTEELEAINNPEDPGMGTRRGLVVLLASVAAGTGLGLLLEALDLIGTGS